MKNSSRTIELPEIIYKLAVYKSLGNELNSKVLETKIKLEIDILYETHQFLDDTQELLAQLNLSKSEVSLLSFVLNKDIL